MFKEYEGCKFTVQRSNSSLIKPSIFGDTNKKGGQVIDSKVYQLSSSCKLRQH